MQRRAQLTGLLVLIVGVLAFPAVGSAAPVRADGCATATAAKSKSKSKSKSCESCRPSLKGSAFGDSDPTAGDVGTTAGSEAILAVKLKGCAKLPKGARMRIIRSEIDFTGTPTDNVTRIDCGRRSCRIPQTR